MISLARRLPFVRVRLLARARAVRLERNDRRHYRKTKTALLGAYVNAPTAGEARRLMFALMVLEHGGGS